MTESQIGDLLREAVDVAANRARYSFRELAGTMLALRFPELRTRENVLSRKSSMYCSAFVQRVFRKAGLDLAPGVDVKNTTPEDIARTHLPHVRYWLQRESPARKRHFPRLERSAKEGI